MKIRLCTICQKPINSRDYRTVVCRDKNCKKIFSHNKYLNTKYIKNCRICGKEFEASGKGGLCTNCKNIKRKHQYKKIYEISHYCKWCNELIKVEKRNYTHSIGKTSYNYLVCRKCKSLKLHNRRLLNPYYKASSLNKHNKCIYNYEQYLVEEFKIRSKFENTSKYYALLYKNEWNKSVQEHKKLILEKLRERMLGNKNPMKNKSISQKVKNTIKTKIESGELVYKRGKERHNFKGNIPFKRIVKYSLHDWVKLHLSNNNFTCQKCGLRGGYLHVHHLKPLRDIIDETLLKHNIKVSDIILGDETCQMLVKEIVKYHYDNMNIGIVVCERCHEIIDKHFHMRKNHRRYYE